jgi:hypothetical protein
VSEPRPEDAPVTGHPEVDAALAGLADLDSAPLAEHHDRLTRAHAALHDTLHGADGDAAPGRPGVPRPPR